MTSTPSSGPPQRDQGAPSSGIDARAGYRSILDALLPLGPELFRTGVVKLNPSHRRAGHLAYGWFFRAQRSVEAVLELDRRGYAEEAAPIRRTVIEHVVALRWIAQEGAAVLETVKGGHALDVRKRVEAVTNAGWTSVDIGAMADIIADIEGTPRDASNDYLLQFAHRVEKYGDVHTLPGYFAECAKTHPSYEAALAYFDVSASSVTPRQTPRDSIPQVPWATTHMLEALLAFREVVEPRPWTDVLRALVVRYFDVTNAVREQDGLLPVDVQAADELVPA